MPLDGVLTRVQNLRETAPLKFGKVKNVQNLARFRTILDFDCKYLWNVLRYRQTVNDLINCRFFFRVEQKKTGEFGFLTTKLCLLISTYPIFTVRAFFGQLSTLTANIFETRKTVFLTTIYSTLNAKNWWTWVH